MALFPIRLQQRQYPSNAVITFVNPLALYQISANICTHMHSDAYIFMAVYHTRSVEMCE